MSAASDELLPGERAPIAEPTAPPRPIEGPAVQAALALKEARDEVNIAIAFLQHNPRDVSLDVSLHAAGRKLAEAHQAFTIYRNILNCAGSA